MTLTPKIITLGQHLKFRRPRQGVVPEPVNLRKQYEDLMNQRNQALAALGGQGLQNAEGKPLVRIEPVVT